MSRFDPDLTVAELLRRDPWMLEVLVAQGFKPLANPVTRQVMSRLVTLRQACERNDRALGEVLAALHAAAGEREAGGATATGAAAGAAPRLAPKEANP